ncbi:sugar phosphate isomerase/epimerase [Eubacteriales bacterium OttesenSCG-928-M02]|nr:sugar phosphate isomerase/epimerase [Eubacteriales bacterium OttesenSCG-928-M02]
MMETICEKVGCSTASLFKRYKTEDAITTMKELGVDVAEVFLGGYYEYTPVFAELLRRRLMENDMVCSSIHSLSTQFEPRLFSTRAELSRRAEEIYRRVLEAGRRLGAKYYVMHGPVRVNMGSRLNGEYVGPRVQRLGSIAWEYGITLTMENVHWCLVSSPREVETLNPYVDGETVGYTFDYKQAMQSGHDPLLYLEAMGDKLKNVHMCGAVKGADGVIQTGLPDPNAPGLIAVKEKLREMNYDGPIVLEVYERDYGEVEELRECMAGLNSLFYGNDGVKK